MEYCVVFSYYQLSQKRPTTISPDKVADFLGCHRDTVFSAKKKAIDAGILVEEGDGVTTSEEWDRNIIFSSGKSEIPTKKSENPTSAQYIYNKDITSKTSVLHESDLSIEAVDDNGDPFTPKWGKKDTSYREVFELFGAYPKSWERNTTQIKAAKAIKKERDWEQVKKAVQFYLDNSEKPFIPNVSTPYDLDTKWEKLLEYKYRDRR